MMVSFVSVKDAAQLSGYDAQYIRNMVNHGRVESLKYGPKRLISVDVSTGLLTRVKPSK